MRDNLNVDILKVMEFFEISKRAINKLSKKLFEEFPIIFPMLPQLMEYRERTDVLRAMIDLTASCLDEKLKDIGIFVKVLEADDLFDVAKPKMDIFEAFQVSRRADSYLWRLRYTKRQKVIPNIGIKVSIWKTIRIQIYDSFRMLSETKHWFVF